MSSMHGPIAFLHDLQRHDLATLLRFSQYRFVEVDVWSDITVPGVEIRSPPVINQALTGLPDPDQQRIAEAIAYSADPPAPTPQRIIFLSDKTMKVAGQDVLLAELMTHCSEMISVATGATRIDDANDYYRARRARIRTSLDQLGWEDPNPHADLWDWFRKWKADLPTYADRRQYVSGLYQPLIERLSIPTIEPVPPREPTGWERVDRAVAKARQSLVQAHHEEDFQAVGLLCREVMISLGQAVYDPAAHASPDGVAPSSSDGGRMIEAFLALALSGSKHEAMRRHARASLQLTLELQHKRTAEFREAAVSLEATGSLANTLAILSGLRDPAE